MVGSGQYLLVMVNIVNTNATRHISSCVLYNQYDTNKVKGQLNVSKLTYVCIACMCVCIYVCGCVCLYVYVCVCVYLCGYVCLYVCVYMFVKRVCEVYVSVRVCMCERVCVYMCVYTCIRSCVFVCLRGGI